MWQLTAATPADRDLIVDTLRAEADRREKAAKESSFRLVTGSPEGRISLKQQRMVMQMHTDAETLRTLAYELAEQPALPVVEPLSAAEVVEEERAATYPALVEITARGWKGPREVPASDIHITDLDTGITVDGEQFGRDGGKVLDVTERRPPGRTHKPRQVKVVNFPDDPDDDLTEAISNHPSNGPQEDQP